MSQPETPRRSIRSSVDREDRWRRRGRWLKRFLIIYAVYLAISPGWPG
ncbi:MAG: hypothetical protein ACRDHV_02940 [Actinomycetota bacterium]